MSEEDFCFSSIEAPSVFDFESVLTAPVTNEDEEDQPPLCDDVWESDDETRAFFRTTDAESKKRHPSREQNPDPMAKQLRSGKPPRYTNRPSLTFEEFLRRFETSNKKSASLPPSHLRVSGNEDNMLPTNSLIPKRSCTPSRQKASTTLNALRRPPVRQLAPHANQPLTSTPSARTTGNSVSPPIRIPSVSPDKSYEEDTADKSLVQDAALRTSRDESSDHPPEDASAQKSTSYDNRSRAAVAFEKFRGDVVRIPRRAQLPQGTQAQRSHQKRQQKQSAQPKQQPNKPLEDIQELPKQHLKGKSQRRQHQKSIGSTMGIAHARSENIPQRRPICSKRAKSFGDPMTTDVQEMTPLRPVTTPRTQLIPRKMGPRSKSARVLPTKQANATGANGELGKEEEDENVAKKGAERDLLLTPLLEERNHHVLRERNRRRSERQRSIRLQKEEALKTFENQKGRGTKAASVAFTSFKARPRQKAHGLPLTELQSDGSGRAGITKQRKDGSIAASRRGLTGLRSQTKRLNGRAVLSSTGNKNNNKNGKAVMTNVTKPEPAAKAPEESDDLQSILFQHNQRVERGRHFRVPTKS